MIINGKEREEEHHIDLILTKQLNTFKSYLLALLKLSANQCDRYLLSIYSHDFISCDDIKTKYEYFLPLMNDIDLKKLVVSSL